MKKTPIIRLILGVIFLALAIFISAFGSGLVLKNDYENLPYTHSYTKAFCNSDNFCQDFEIFCKNKNIVKVIFTGTAVQFQDNWRDPRAEEKKIGNC